MAFAPVAGVDASRFTDLSIRSKRLDARHARWNIDIRDFVETLDWQEMDCQAIKNY